MKTKLIRSVLAAGMIAFVLGFFVLFIPAAETVELPAATGPAAVVNLPLVTPAPALTAPVADQLTALLTKFPKVSAALALFATLSAFYQVAIAFAHKRAAETTEINDDQWLAALEAKPWFKVLDRIFYWGGYLGAWSGGKKL